MPKLNLMMLLTFSIFAFMFALASCTVDTEEEADKKVDYKKITAEEAKTLMEKEEVIILDVRTEEEFADIRIEGAVLIPDYEIEALAEEMLPDKDATILVYCRTGRRSEEASRSLINMGYTRVYDFGGIVDWEYETSSGD